jgi:hypothetical protein
LWNVSGLEAIHRDYAPKGVKFYFIYKTLAHPELAGNYVQPFELSERLAHARQAEKELGASIPWLVDAMDNRLKHALGNMPNSEFILDPKGKIVRKRPWSHPGLVRKDLEELVGKVDRITREEDIKLKLVPPIKPAAQRGVLPRIKRPGMQALAMEALRDPKGPAFLAKLRAEGNAGLLKRGEGKLYLGFHLDPFHNGHWNNLTPPLRFRMAVPEGTKLAKLEYEAPRVKAATDSAPREFLLDVKGWPEGKPIVLTVTYSACVGEKACYTAKQSYVLQRRRDPDGGGARGEGAGFWTIEEVARMMLPAGKDKVSEKEVMGLVRPHFHHFDANKDGFLDREELKTFVKWVNEHHKPGAMPKPKK